VDVKKPFGKCDCPAFMCNICGKKGHDAEYCGVRCPKCKRLHAGGCLVDGAVRVPQGGRGLKRANPDDTRRDLDDARRKRVAAGERETTIQLIQQILGRDKQER
jgi:hypothetical protein